MSAGSARFSPGELVHHTRFDYRGVVVDVDPVFMGSDEWYEQMALSKPPRDAPWYHVLVHGAEHSTYVAERNLEPDDTHAPIEHPALADFFHAFEDGRYVARQSLN